MTDFVQAFVHRARISAAMSLAVALLGACTETFTGGEGCPELCPSRPTVFRDTILDAVVLDSTVGGYPELGLSPLLLLANRTDTLETRGVIRFDVLPTSFLPNNGSTSESITTVDSVFLVLPLDTTARRGANPVLIEAFDVDTTENDSMQVVVKSLFRPDRLLGSTTITPGTQGDSLRITLSRTALAAKIAVGARLRVGLRMSGGQGQLRLVAFAQGSAAPRLRFDPTTDTTYAPVTVSPSTSIADATSDLILSYLVYGLTDRGSPVPDATTLLVGGFPAYRSYLRFNVPVAISDSSTIVRAEVLLTQKPSSFANVSDTVSVLPLIPTSTEAVTDMRRILDLSADGFFASIDSIRLVPRDSGQRVLNVLTLARSWAVLPDNVPRAIAFRIGLEGGQPAELRFFSSESAPALRPRLRLTYLPRTESAIP